MLVLFPQAMFPNSPVRGLEWLLPLIVFAIAGSTSRWRRSPTSHNVKATVTGRGDRRAVDDQHCGVRAAPTCRRATG
jgi:hypothetical protein